MKKRMMSLLLAAVLLSSAVKSPAFASENTGAEKADVLTDQKEILENEQREDKPEVSEAPKVGQEVLESENPDSEAGNAEEKRDTIEAPVDLTEDGDSNFSDWEEPWQETEEFFDTAADFDVAVLTEENTEHMEAETPEGKELLDEMQDGEVIAFAPVSEEILTGSDSAAVVSGEEEVPAVALSPGQYVITSGRHVYCDEFWTKKNVADAVCNDTIYRSIKYIDSEGKEAETPLYCMNAKKLGISPGASGQVLKDAAYKLLQNTNLKKILYFGYGGPGTITQQYDPTCSHIDWTKTDNRYFFTHMALSIEFAKDYNYATKAQVEHMGVQRWLDKLKSKTLPSRSGVAVRAPNASGTLLDANPATVYLKYYRTKPSSGYQWLDGSFQNGFQISRMCTVKDLEGIGNGITVTRKATDTWQMIYWTNNQEAIDHPDNPAVLAKGKSVTLKNGYKFKFIFPKATVQTMKFTYPMLLRPVQYLFVDGDKQAGGSGYQDFGAYVYQGEKGSVSIQFVPQKTGSIALKKTSSMNGAAVAGAIYRLYAAEDIYTAAEKFYTKNALVSEGKTNAEGQIQFQELLPGKYYIKESTAAPGYLLDTASYNCTVTASASTAVNVKDVPDIKGTVSVRKTDQDTGQVLTDAEFTIYAWNQSANKYQAAGKLRYDLSKEQYVSGTLTYSETNKGRFQIKETRHPSGYTGEWEKKFVLTAESREFFYEVTNKPTKLLRGSITVVKKIKEADIIWAHGNPVFGFVVEGTDEKGGRKKYEDSIVFMPENYETDAQGYAVSRITFTNVPPGSYEIYEKPVLRYFLKDVRADTGNVSIRRGKAPAYGLLPKETAYAQAVLDAQSIKASIVFINEKSRYDDYSHNCIIENTIPIVFGE